MLTTASVASRVMLAAPAVCGNAGVCVCVCVCAVMPVCVRVWVRVYVCAGACLAVPENQFMAKLRTGEPQAVTSSLIE